jgi:citrate lyase beta subunit
LGYHPVRTPPLTPNDDLIERLRRANARALQRYPGENRRRQPVHTVYGGAHLFRADTAQRLGTNARKALEQYAPEPGALAAALALSPGPAAVIRQRVAEKLEREPVEDFRLDFEDGYGNRPDREEDDHAVAAAREVARGLAARSLPPFVGIRIKPLTDELCERALRTTEMFLGELLERTSGTLPDNFVVTLPKITSAEQVAVLAERFSRLEAERRLAHGALRMELMVETPQAILDERGVGSLPAMIDAGGGRITAAHFGTYDYTASLGITAAHQHMRHPACDFARHMTQVMLAGTGVWLSDGATNVLPVPIHRAEPGTATTPEQEEANRAAIHRAWKLHYDDVRHSLSHGFYQGWDLHPSQLVTRYAAVYAFFLESLEPASERLRNFISKAAQATLVGEVFDDAATGQGLLNYFLRALNCGAVRESEIGDLTGLTLDELRSGSFVKIVKGRR